MDASEKFGERVWRGIEESQGYAYIADDIETKPDAEALRIAKICLEWHKRSVRILAQLIAHEERRQTAGDGQIE
jgi:hypothetical protein